MNQTFDTRRFDLYVRKYAMENRSRLLLLGAVTVLAPVVAILLGTLFSAYNYPSTVDEMWSSEMKCFPVLAVLLAAVMGSKFYSELASKNGRLSLLSFPASNLEKFCTSLLFYFICFIPLYIFGTFLADVLRVAVGRYVAAEGATVDFISLRYVLDGGAMRDSVGSLHQWAVDQYAAQYWSMACICILGSFCSFALGSAVWPKNSMLKSCAFFFVFFQIWGLILALGFKVWGINSSGIALSGKFWTLIVTVDCIFTAISLFSLWLSYARFKEWEVIKRW